DELIQEDRNRQRRRRITWLVSIILVVAAIVAVGIIGYNWTQTNYYVGDDHGYVAIYRGVQQNIGPIELSTVYRKTTIALSDLSGGNRDQVKATISASSRELAEQIVERLADASN
ncbi:MAG TPA: serine/threonine-protein phosphatase, partial [Galbitalea sp.]|nr:serine/threonine-protein phosphatase [Galbitalea sp.]